MNPSQQDSTPLPSPEPSQASSSSFSIPPSNYLTVPSTKPSGTNHSLPSVFPFAENSPALVVPSLNEITSSDSLFPKHEALRSNPPINSYSSSSPPYTEGTFSYSDSNYMSVYSTTSASSEHSTYSNPPARIYRVPSFQKMSGSRKTNVAEKDQMIQSLQSHHVNTLVGLRRIERVFAVLGSPDVTEPMTAAWSYYVNSHGLLTEMRGLTKNYPFSSECLEEAKNRVYSDPQSNRSWNFCWLVLSKIKNDQLISYYAQYQAAQPVMWGGHTPTAEGALQLSAAFIAEWNWALNQMLRHWDKPPSR